MPKTLRQLGWLFLLLSTSCAAVAAQPKSYSINDIPQLSQEPQHATAAQRVTAAFTRAHYKHINLNDAFSEKIFDRYLDMLDYNHMIFTQDEVEQLRSKFQDVMDDALKTGKLGSSYAILEAALKKRFTDFKYALSLLDEEKPFDFTRHESFQYDREDAAWPASEAELHELWRKRVKYDALNLILADKSEKEAYDLLRKRYKNVLRRLTQTNSEDVFQTFMNAFARSIDPHTSYMSPRNAEQFKTEMNLSLEGIGAVLQADYDYTVIRKLIAGGPAEKNGELKPGDKILGVAQEDGDMVDVVGWRLDEVVDLIKGPKGSKVTLLIEPEHKGGKGATKKVTITRDKVRLEDRAASSEVKTVGEGDNAVNIGVITVPSFYNNLSDDVKKLITKLKKEDIKGLVIDLRNDGGGSLPEARLLSGLFIKSGPVVQIRDLTGRVQEEVDRDGVSYYDGPMTVLVNRLSASASEIFSAAMKDYGRAVIVGEQTFGKGTVQQHRGLGRIYDFFDKSLGDIQFTIAKFYRVTGGSTQLRGVSPDLKLPDEGAAEEYGESKEENALPWDHISKSDYTPVNAIPNDLSAMRKQHQARMAADPEFAYIREDVARFAKEQEDKTISLNEAVRRQEGKDADARALKRENERRARAGLKPVKSLDDVDEDDADYREKDPYLDETAHITKDLADELAHE